MEEQDFHCCVSVYFMRGKRKINRPGFTVLFALLLSRTRKPGSLRWLVPPFVCEHSIDDQIMDASIQPCYLAECPLQRKAQSLLHCPAPLVFCCSMDLYF